MSAPLYTQRLGNRRQPVLVLLHGFLGSHKDWYEVTDRLEFGFDKLIIDLPGHGKSLPPPAFYSLENTCRSILTLLDEQHIDSCILLGYSMGGRLALHLAVTFPHRFRALILESASPGITEESERRLKRQWEEKIIRKLQTSDMATFIHDWYKNPLFHSLRRHPDFTMLVKRRCRNDPEALGLALRNLGAGTMPSLWCRLAELKMPVLTICGELDRKYRTISKKIMDANPAISVITAPDCGHNIHFENSTYFCNTVNTFLHRLKKP